MNRRHGYFLAHTRTERGDPELSRGARLLWRKSGHRCPGRFDGVAIHTHETGATVILFVYTDFFVGGLPKPVAFRGWEDPPEKKDKKAAKPV